MDNESFVAALADKLWNDDWMFPKKTELRFTPEKPKGIATYDNWVSENILSVVEGKKGIEIEEAIDGRLSLLREWIRLLRYKGMHGQLILSDVVVNKQTNKYRTFTYDIRNFEAFCRYKDRQMKAMKFIS